MPTPAPRLQAFRAGILHFVDDPAQAGDAAVVAHEDGLLVLADGKVRAFGEAAELLPGLPPEVELTDYRGRLLMPGFIDCHAHYPQTDVIASPGEQLLRWLERYVFPCEARFADATVARETAGFFCDELLRNGTTSAQCFATVHPQAVDALFAAAEARGMRMTTGLVLMDRNAPAALSVDAELAHAQGEELIARWHGRGRARYAVTPRFAATSSARQLELAGRQFAAHPGVHLQSHLAENRGEVAWVAELFPAARSYLDVFDRYGLLGERAIYAHCIHIDDTDRRRLAESGSAIAFCPTSNLFLGSGLFDIDAARAQGVGVGLATDVGAGTSFSMLRTMSEAYKVGQLRGRALSPWSAFYHATLGAARALRMEDTVGSFAPGCEGDFVVLDLQATPLLARRVERARDLEERLFALMTLGDDRAVNATWVMGECRHRRGAA
ncbi:guanine deaminase [Thauera phenolivorans]|uniref:guanine deaminase n=1 Tax=Thauera phenolivorans TaxID=1792543 RepID=UPI00083B83BF|nr:guanine deaminase [Thauera phenolivorans]